MQETDPISRLFVDAARSAMMRGFVLPRSVLDRLTFDELDELGLCDCGVQLAVHPPLPNPKPMASWLSTRNIEDTDRRKPKPHQGFSITFGNRPRIGHKGRKTGPRPEPTKKQLEALRLVRLHGTAAAAARELGISAAAVKTMLKRIKENYGLVA